MTGSADPAGGNVPACWPTRRASTRRRQRATSARSRRRGFTLVELAVTMAIAAILGALATVSLAGIRTRAKVAKTRSTIRKIHEAIVPRYDAYLDRRLDDSMWRGFEHEIDRSQLGLAAGTPRRAAWKRLVQIRGMMVHEMPDQWIDVRYPSYPNDPTDPMRAAGAPPGTPVIERFLRHVDSWVDRADPARQSRDAVLAGLGRSAASAETLFIVVALGSFEPDALDPFRADEFGDADGDGAREFSDGFGRPIHFLRWAPGAMPRPGLRLGTDPFDPYGLGGPGTFPLTPLIVSAGPDERIALRRDATQSIDEEGSPWSAARPNGVSFVPLPFDPFSRPEAGSPEPMQRYHLDNVTNLGMGSP